MRPRPSELVSGIRAVLRDVIAPELTSEHAQTRLAEIRAVLAQVDWDEAGFALVARNTALANALDGFAAWADGEVRGSFAEVADRVGSALVPAAELSFRAHAEWSERLAAAAVALVDPLTDWIAVHPEDGSAIEVRAAIVAAL